MKPILVGLCVYIAIGIAHAIYMERVERRNLANMGGYVLALLALVWPLYVFAAIVEWRTGKRR